MAFLIVDVCRLAEEDQGRQGGNAGQVGDSKGASLGCHLNIGYRHHFALFATIRHFNAKEKDEVQLCKCCGK